MDELFKQINKDIQDHTGERNSSQIIENDMYTEFGTSNIRHADRIMPPFSVFNSTVKQTTPIKHLTKESLSFLSFLTMTKILCQISSYKPEELLEMWMACRNLYKENQSQLDYIDKLEARYKACKAIEYYTGDSCLSRTVNQACHTENMKEIYTFRVFIYDLHEQLVECHKNDGKNDLRQDIQKVYRGKPLSGSVLQQLIDNEGGLISMNGFLSTTLSENVASFYHSDNQVNTVREGWKSVLFVFMLDTKIKRPFGYIGTCSTKPDELEVLFSLGTIWRIKSIEFKKDPCIIELIPSDDVDSQTNELFQKYTGKECTLSSIGDILFQLGDIKDAEWFYEKSLKQDLPDDKTRASLHYKIGQMQFEREEYSAALNNFERALSLLPSTNNESDEIKVKQPKYVCDAQSPLFSIYNNIGLIYEKDGESKTAITYYQKALQIDNTSKLQKAKVYNNLGLLQFRCGIYDEAQKNHAKAIELIDNSYSEWEEFTKNFDRANQRCQHLVNKKHNN